jgi:3-phenylpropionate/cinnamic acid dioxygenase small subunit|tara:strand:+ start:2381 stop:2920 length:540 start_codon:yes stop_codon:yes gene_type:complete
MTHSKKYKMADIILQHEVEQFYYMEAQFLDNRDFSSWFDILDEEIRYFMPIRTNRIQRESSMEYTKDNEFAHFDDTYEMIRGRIRKLQADVGWSENPASRTRHLIANIIIDFDEKSDRLDVSSCFILYRNRLERQVDIFSGRRQDELLRVDRKMPFKIRNRTIHLDQSTVLSNNLSILF